MTTFHHFALPQYPPSFESRGHVALVELLEPFGIVLMPEAGSVIYTVDDITGKLMRRSGAVHVRGDGVIEGRPHVGSAESDRFALLQTAHLAFLRKPTRRDGWRLSRRGGHSSWSKHVWIHARHDDPVTVAARAAGVVGQAAGWRPLPRDVSAS